MAALKSAAWACAQVGTVEQYLAKGPGFIFLFHPALGPMWDVIAQKIRGGALMHGSELVLEVRLQGSCMCAQGHISRQLPISRAWNPSTTDVGSLFRDMTNLSDVCSPSYALESNASASCLPAS